MAGIDFTNHSACLYATGIQDKMAEICSPLKHLQIDSFTYLKIFRDSSYLCLSSENIKFIKNYFTQVDDQGQYFGEFVRETGREYNYKLFPKYPENDHLLNFAYEHNVWPAFVIGHKREDYFEDFVFAFNRMAEKNTKLLVHNLSLLHKFISYFKIAAKDLIDCTDKSKLAVYKNKIDLNLECEPISGVSFKQQFLEHISLRKSGVVGKFSNQEYRCIELLAKGKTMKETGRILNISTRTVESYIENAKDKTGYSSKSQIIDLFWRDKHILL